MKGPKPGSFQHVVSDICIPRMPLGVMPVMILWFLYLTPLLWCPPKNLGPEMQAIRGQQKGASTEKQAISDQLLVSPLAALMNCNPGFITAQLKGFLLKLQIPAVDSVEDLRCQKQWR